LFQEYEGSFEIHVLMESSIKWILKRDTLQRYESIKKLIFENNIEKSVHIPFRINPFTEWMQFSVHIAFGL